MGRAPSDNPPAYSCWQYPPAGRSVGFPITRARRATNAQNGAQSISADRGWVGNELVLLRVRSSSPKEGLVQAAAVTAGVKVIVSHDLVVKTHGYRPLRSQHVHVGLEADEVAHAQERQAGRGKHGPALQPTEPARAAASKSTAVSAGGRGGVSVISARVCPTCVCVS